MESIVVVENYPEGYPRISAYVDSDVDTVLFRRFGNLHARSLLHKQVELTELEAQLDKLDKDDDVRGNGWLLREPLLEGRARNDIRKALMQNIDKKMEAYGMNLAVVYSKQDEGADRYR